MRAWALAAAALSLSAMPGWAETVTEARFIDPTDRYGHGILGDAIEWGGLQITTAAGDGSGTRTTYRITQPLDHVFEDVTPRLWDIDGDGDPEVVVVDTDMALGARLAIYDQTGLVAATPHIGRTNRWLAPIGAADLDNDGRIEIGYIDRPHLARTLRLWRLEAEGLVEVAALEGVTNHRIGEADIAGGIRDCGQGPEMIVASADWTRLVAVTFDGAQLAGRAIGPHRDRGSFAAALACQN